MTDRSGDHAPRILNLGSGKKPVSGAVNVDRTHAFGADVVHDLDRRPWPFPDNAFDEVRASDVIEHLESVVAAFEEIHRVSREGAIVKVTVPHFSCATAFTDPTHRHYFGWFTFDYLTGENEISYYTKARFRKRSLQLIFYPSLLNKIVWRLANRFPEAYERRWAWVFPAWFLAVDLEVKKSSTGSEGDLSPRPADE